ncbi:MAG TPA: peptidase M28 family protein, partial [Bacteroidia bacterium]|nr:peptidase M28 family protein [Bacteroidia bacterium]
MNRFVTCLFLLCTTATFSQSSDSLIIRKFYEESFVNGKTYHWLGEICSSIGPRVSGSPQAEMAVNYLKKELDQLSLDSVYLQDVMVPHWVRGKKESAYFLDGKAQKSVNICALGGSIATPKGGLKAGIVEVHNFDEL